LQTFPDTYKFAGSFDQISVQIGNAVPVGLAEVFAQYFNHLEHTNAGCLTYVLGHKLI
jgi:site-specific DNA-cytosine methylase